MTNNCAQVTCILVTKPNLSHDITTFYKTRTGGSITGGMAKYVSNTVQFKKVFFAWDVEKKRQCVEVIATVQVCISKYTISLTLSTSSSNTLK